MSISTLITIYVSLSLVLKQYSFNGRITLLPENKSSLPMDAYILVKIVATETIMVTPSNSVLLQCAGVEQKV